MNNFRHIRENQQLTSTRILFPEISSIGSISTLAVLQEYIEFISHNDYLSKIDEYLEMAFRLEFSKNWPVSVLEKYLEDPLHLSMMMMNSGDADHLIAGYSYDRDDIIRSAIRLIG